MPEALTLTEIRFDNLENHDPIRRKIIGVFVDGEELNAFGKIGEFLKKQKPVHIYLGHDGEFYPQYRITSVEAH